MASRIDGAPEREGELEWRDRIRARSAQLYEETNRSAQVERPFDHIERKLPRRPEFTDFAGANRRARAWCDQINAKFRCSWQASSNALAIESAET